MSEQTCGPVNQPTAPTGMQTELGGMHRFAIRCRHSVAVLLAWPAVLERLVRWPRAALCDRRGVTAFAFAAIAASLLGVVGLGTDVGVWYLKRAQAQSAADAAALAGALSLAEGSSQAVALTAAARVAQQNGYATGASISGTLSSSPATATTTAGVASVTINNPPASGAYTSSTKSVEAIITETQSRYFSGLFLASAPTITARAVATVANLGPACALATGNVSNALAIGGNSTITGAGCTLASNSTASPAIYVYGSPVISASALVSMGSCSGCGSSPPFEQSAIPVSSPFSAADSTRLPSFSNCQNNSPPVPYETSPVANCSLSLTSSTSSVTLAPGTYFFTNSVDIEGGSITCTCSGGNGVTIVLTHVSGGTNASLTINGNINQMQLTAPMSNATFPGLGGLLFYEDPTGTQSGPKINGNSNVALTGGMYFPEDSITFNGNAKFNSTKGTNQPVSTCLEIVAYGINTSGNSTTAFDSSGCQQDGYGSYFGAQVQVVRLVE